MIPYVKETWFKISGLIGLHDNCKYFFIRLSVTVATTRAVFRTAISTVVGVTSTQTLETCSSGPTPTTPRTDWAFTTNPTVTLPSVPGYMEREMDTARYSN